MTPEQYQQVKSAFRSSTDLPPELREKSLRQIFGSDETLLAAVLDLLAADALPHTAIDQPIVSPQFRLRTRSLARSAARHPRANAGY